MNYSVAAFIAVFDNFAVSLAAALASVDMHPANHVRRMQQFDR
jgi:hypothetical protein